jgi:hypothetical protein
MVKDTQGKDTNMEGCYWNILANTMLKYQELDLVVFKIENGNLIWLYISSIQQDSDEEENNIEIMKQATLFKGATRAAVWLLEGEDLFQDICSWNL